MGSSNKPFKATMFNNWLKPLIVVMEIQVRQEVFKIMYSSFNWDKCSHVVRAALQSYFTALYVTHGVNPLAAVLQSEGWRATLR